MIQLAVVDDNALLRENIIERIHAKYALWLDTASATELIEALAATPVNAHPALILMDIEMDEMDGITATAIIKATYPAIKVAMLTVFEQEDRVLRSIEAGADGYLLKDEKKDKLLEAIEDILQGGAYMSPEIARKAMALLKQRNQVPERDSLTASLLTRREIEILEFVAAGLSYRQIGERLYISTYTVKTHIHNIYEKLQVRNKIEATAKFWPQRFSSGSIQ